MKIPLAFYTSTGSTGDGFTLYDELSEAKLTPDQREYCTGRISRDQGAIAAIISYYGKLFLFRRFRNLVRDTVTARRSDFTVIGVISQSDACDIDIKDVLSGFENKFTGGDSTKAEKFLSEKQNYSYDSKRANGYESFDDIEVWSSAGISRYNGNVNALSNIGRLFRRFEGNLTIYISESLENPKFSVDGEGKIKTSKCGGGGGDISINNSGNPPPNGNFLPQGDRGGSSNAFSKFLILVILAVAGLGICWWVLKSNESNEHKGTLHGKISIKCPCCGNISQTEF